MKNLTRIIKWCTFIGSIVVILSSLYVGKTDWTIIGLILLIDSEKDLF